MVESVSLAFSDLHTGIAHLNLVRVLAIWCVVCKHRVGCVQLIAVRASR